MYSDIYKDNIKKKVRRSLISNRNLYYSYIISKNDEPIIFSLDFEYADDGHIELLYEDTIKLKKVLHEKTHRRNFIVSLKKYFKKYCEKGKEYDNLIVLLRDNNIDFKCMIYY